MTFPASTKNSDDVPSSFQEHPPNPIHLASFPQNRVLIRDRATQKPYSFPVTNGVSDLMVTQKSNAILLSNLSPRVSHYPDTAISSVMAEPCP